MEIKSIDYFINREKNKPCLLAGTAPSIKNFPFNRFKGLYFMVNSGPLLLNKLATPNYWISANFKNPVPSLHFKKINKFKDCVYIFSDTASYARENNYDYGFIKEKLKVSWFAFDDRHTNHKKCSPLDGCCHFVDLYPQRETVFEMFKKLYNLPELCPSPPSTSAIYLLMFAILTGCSPIYLQGIELPLYQKDYVQYRMCHFENLRNIKYVLRSYLRGWMNGRPEYSGFYDGYDRTFAAFEYFINLGHRLGIKIYNLSPTSALNKIKILPYLDYRKVC
ncbi:MAG: hypothetical protein PHC29_07325 [Candidatus Omnitrophica bacterium]|jgi:hypothetical protein|nr:hypothetical protein [Candidatus Omnitrophota bacterium]